MRIEVQVPQLPGSVADATLVNWRKKLGEAVKRDENLIDIETDKVVLELPAPGDGLLSKVIKGDGGTVTSNEVIATIDTDAKAPAGAPTAGRGGATYAMRHETRGRARPGAACSICSTPTARRETARSVGPASATPSRPDSPLATPAARPTPSSAVEPG